MTSVKLLFPYSLLHPDTGASHEGTSLVAPRSLSFTHLEYDGGPRLLLQHPRQAEGLQVGVGVVDEAGAVVGEQRLHVVEHEAELVHVLHRLLALAELGLQGRGEAADGGGVQHLAHLVQDHQSFIDTTHTLRTREGRMEG